jgi:hypothetical protein
MDYVYVMKDLRGNTAILDLVLIAVIIMENAKMDNASAILGIREQFVRIDM